MKYLLSEESGVILDTEDIKTSKAITSHCGLALDDDDNVGRRVRYTDPKYPVEEYEYTIIGRQMAWGYDESGKYTMMPAYRLACSREPFGRPAHLYELSFIDEVK